MALKNGEICLWIYSKLKKTVTLILIKYFNFFCDYYHYPKGIWNVQRNHGNT